MSLRLVVIRHAEADHGGSRDDARPLNGTGHRAADAVGRWLAETRLDPDEVLCSSALRARQTWERIAGRLPAAPAPRWEDRLYAAASDDILSVLHGAEGRTVAIVGHNPGIGEFAAGILSAPPAHPLFGEFPTGAALVARFATADWRGVLWGSGTVEQFVVPHDLG